MTPHDELVTEILSLGVGPIEAMRLYRLGLKAINEGRWETIEGDLHSRPG